MYRPENWGNPYAPADYPSGVVSAFEAGADAILRALLESDNVIKVSKTTITTPGFLADLYAYLTSFGDGTFVFIPDEAEDENIEP